MCCTCVSAERTQVSDCTYNTRRQSRSVRLRTDYSGLAAKSTQLCAQFNTCPVSSDCSLRNCARQYCANYEMRGYLCEERKFYSQVDPLSRAIRAAACLSWGQNITAKGVHLTSLYPTALTTTNDHLSVLRHYVTMFVLNAKLCSI